MQKRSKKPDLKTNKEIFRPKKKQDRRINFKEI